MSLKSQIARRQAIEWATEQLSRAQSVGEIEEISDFDWIYKHAKEDGLTDRQISLAREVILAQYMRAIGRC